MKRTYLVLSVLIMLAATAGSVMAQQRGDSDGDGIMDRRDDCPNEPGPRENRGCPVAMELVPVQPPPPADSDGDGLPDSDDQCPNQAGPRENRGCPVMLIATPQPEPPPPGVQPPQNPDEIAPVPLEPTVPPNNNDVPNQPPADSDVPNQTPADPPPPGEPTGNPGDLAPSPLLPTVTPDMPTEPPPFQPPLLPSDACYVTPATNNNVNVRKAPAMSADVIGSLNAGVVYEAMGYVFDGTDSWFVLNTYEGFAGDIGYSARAALLTTTDCPQIAPPLVPDELSTWERPTDVEIPDTREELCVVTVGFDASIWGAPGMGDVFYAAFYFEEAPGAPLEPGTPIWGVVSIAPYITMTDPDNAVAFATTLATYELAQNAPYGGAYNWPTLAGGIEAGGNRYYRLTTETSNMACGPIEGSSVDGFASAAEDNILEADPTCDKNAQGVVEACSCSSTDGDCLVKLVAECKKHTGGQLEPGPENTVCWTNEPGTTSSTNGDTGMGNLALENRIPPPPSIDDWIAAQSGETEAKPSCSSGICECSNIDGECLVQLVADCQGEGDWMDTGAENTYCFHPDEMNDDDDDSND